MAFDKQEEALDGLMDGTPANIESLADQVFDNLIEANNESVARLSSYKLAEMWNNSDAVQFGLACGKTANDFHSDENWKS